MDLVNFSKEIATLNLGYLTVSVTIIAILGGIFVYFNIKPLKEGLDKQEGKIDDLKKEAIGLLNESSVQVNNILEKYKSDQSLEIKKVLDLQKETIDLEVRNEIQELRGDLLEKIEIITDSKDENLMKTLVSEITIKLSVLEKTLTTLFKTEKEELVLKIKKGEELLRSLQSDLKDAQRDIVELKIYKYSKENQMGAIINSIDLVKQDIDEKSWRLLGSLERLEKEITGCKLENEYISKIEEQLARIADDPKYALIIGNIKKKYIK